MLFSLDMYSLDERMGHFGDCGWLNKMGCSTISLLSLPCLFIIIQLQIFPAILTFFNVKTVFFQGSQSLSISLTHVVCDVEVNLQLETFRVVGHMRQKIIFIYLPQVILINRLVTFSFVIPFLFLVMKIP